MKTFILMCHFGDKINLTNKCLESLLKYDNSFYEVLIANNNKEDLDEKLLIKNKKILVFNNGKNLGYGGGINSLIPIALERGATHLFFINNDCLITAPFLEKMANFSDSMENKVIVGIPLSYKKDGKEVFDIGGKISEIGKPYHLEANNLSISKPERIDFAGCVLVPREVIEKVKGFDENFFLYFEDVDFCLRAKQYGFSTYIINEISMKHGRSETVGIESPRAIYHQTRSGVLYIKKYKKYLFAPSLFFSTVKRCINKYSRSRIAIKGLVDGILNNLDQNMIS
jgi:GT2 family glycosyltransferase